MLPPPVNPAAGIPLGHARSCSRGPVPAASKAVSRTLPPAGHGSTLGLLDDTRTYIRTTGSRCRPSDQAVGERVVSARTRKRSPERTLDGIGVTSGYSRPSTRKRPVLTEVMIERERTRDVARVEHGERDRIAQRPVLVDMPRQDVLRALLFGGKDRDDGEVAGQQPLSGNDPSESPEQEGMRLRFDVVRDEARSAFGRNLCARCRRLAHGRHRRRRAARGSRSSPRGRRASFFEDRVLVSGAGRVPAATSRRRRAGRWGGLQ